MTDSVLRMPRRYRLWTTGGCEWVADPTQLGAIIDVLGVHGPLTGAFFAPILNSVAICDGPNGQPCVAVQDSWEFAGVGLSSIVHGPFVFEWDGATWNMLADASSDGGLGTEQVNGVSMAEVSSGTVNSTFDWDRPSGTYTTRVYDAAGIPPPMQDIAADGESLYASWGHCEVTGAGASPTHTRSYWRVKQWDGAAWTELGDENTHQAMGTAPASVLEQAGSLKFGNKMLASSEDVGHPYMLYIDNTSGPVHTLYVSRWSGSAWVDLGSLTMPTNGLSVFTASVDFALGASGNPTVVWGDSDTDPIELVINTWDGAAWNQVTPDLPTLLDEVVFTDLSVQKVSIAPYEAALDRHLIAIRVIPYDPVGDVFDNQRVYVLEYFPGTGTVQPAFNDTAKARVGTNATLSTPNWVTMLQAEVSTYWLFIHQSGSGPGELWRYDAECDNEWEFVASPDISFPDTGLTAPARAYLKDRHIYQGILESDEDASNLWRGHVVDDYAITCDPCAGA